MSRMGSTTTSWRAGKRSSTRIRAGPRPPRIPTLLQDGWQVY
jgi:hypothetical protein